MRFRARDALSHELALQVVHQLAVFGMHSWHGAQFQAALKAGHQRVVGGHDRGLDWQVFADALRAHAPVAVVTMGQNGPRIHALLAQVTGEAGFALHAAGDLAEAMTQARDALAGEGAILLSPGAPSFGAYRDYADRGRHFATLSGFDPRTITAIPGIGIA